MTMRIRHLGPALALLITPAIASSQQASADSMPSSGTWGAEVFIGSGGTGASLLRFMSPSRALLFGADFDVARVDDDSEGPFNSGSGTQASVAARFGVRSYRESSNERLRPVLGFGARGSYGRGPSEIRSWSTGVYGELGAVYFLTPNVSLGGTGEVRASYGKRKQTLSAGPSIEATTTAFGGSLMRVMLAVYF
jgi:hypothetical protein